MKKKIKCNVCGTRFVPERLQKYTAENEASGLLKLTTANVLYDAFDCPQCGVQIKVGVRFPKYYDIETGAETGIETGTENED